MADDTLTKRFHSMEPEDVAWRSEQARISNAIEGISEGEELSSLSEMLDAKGVGIERQIAIAKTLDYSSPKMLARSIEEAMRCL